MTLPFAGRSRGLPLALVVGVALAALVFGVSAAGPAHAEVAECDPGWSTKYVAVVVGSSVTCVTPGGSGLDVLDRAAGGLRFDDSGLLCAIAGEPATGCGQATGGGSYEYWAYFTCRSGSGGFQYSSVGPGSRSPVAGDVEGWNFIIGSGANETPPSPSVDVCSADVTTTASTSEPTPEETTEQTSLATRSSALGSTTGAEPTTSAGGAGTTRAASGVTSRASIVEATSSRSAPVGRSGGSTAGEMRAAAAAAPAAPSGPHRPNAENAPTGPTTQAVGTSGPSAPSIDLAAIAIALGAAPNSSVGSLDLAAIGQLAQSSSASSFTSASNSRATQGGRGGPSQPQGGDTALSVRREPAENSFNWQALLSAGAVVGMAGAALVTRRRRAARTRPIVEAVLGE